MSIAEEIRNIAYELLNARGEFSIEDVREKLNEKNIFSDSKNASLRVTISQMVKRIHILSALKEENISILRRY